MKTFTSIEEIAEAAGQEVGTSDWVEVTQHHIDLFADATGDHQWIHIDEERSADGPFGGTIAHGYLTLALLVPMLHQVYEVKNMRMGINYGLDRVRFVNPVRAGSRLRARATLKSATPLPDGAGVQLAWSVVIELEGSDKPACVAEPVTRIYS